VTGPVVDVDPDGLYGHAARAQNRATDFHVAPLPLDTGGGFASPQAVDDGQQSAGGAGAAFGNRQDARGRAVKAAADGYVGQDKQSAGVLDALSGQGGQEFDMAKYMQGVGAVLAPFGSSVSGMSQALVSPFTTALQAGAQELGAMFQAAGGLLGQPLGRLTPQAGALAGAEAPSGGAAAPAVGADTKPSAGLGSPVAGNGAPDRADRDNNHEHEHVTSVNGSYPTGGGMGMPLTRGLDSGGGATGPTTTKRVVVPGEKIRPPEEEHPEPPTASALPVIEEA
jgi:hypothetical protein